MKLKKLTKSVAILFIVLSFLFLFIFFYDAYRLLKSPSIIISIMFMVMYIIKIIYSIVVLFKIGKGNSKVFMCYGQTMLIIDSLAISLTIFVFFLLFVINYLISTSGIDFTSIFILILFICLL